MVLPATSELEHFYRVTLEPEQFAGEIQRLRGLWPDFNLHFAQAGCSRAHQSASCLAGTWPWPPARYLASCDRSRAGSWS